MLHASSESLLHVMVVLLLLLLQLLLLLLLKSKLLQDHSGRITECEQTLLEQLSSLLGVKQPILAVVLPVTTLVPSVRRHDFDDVIVVFVGVVAVMAVMLARRRRSVTVVVVADASRGKFELTTRVVVMMALMLKMNESTVKII